MKQIFTFIIILSSVVTFAQQPEVDTTHSELPDTLKKVSPDTTFIDFPNNKVIIIEKTDAEKQEYKEKKGKKKKKRTFDSNFGGIELGLNSYITPNQSLSLNKDEYYLDLEDSKSVEFNLNLFDVSVPIIKERMGIISGLGFSWNNYHFENKQLILQNDSSVLYYDSVSKVTYEKNKLTGIYLTAPLALEFHFPVAEKEIWLLVGGYVGVKIGSNQKLVTENDDKVKVKEDFHLSTFRYGLRAQVGVNSWSIYCTYSAAPLFKENEGPELYPVSLGLALSF